MIDLISHQTNLKFISFLSSMVVKKYKWPEPPSLVKNFMIMMKKPMTNLMLCLFHTKEKYCHGDSKGETEVQQDFGFV